MFEIYDRNKGIFDKKEYGVVPKAPIVVFGCGLGGVIAELALRSGITNITVVDGDTVSATNLNRQIFTADDVGKYKAERLALRLRQINPNSNIVAINEYVSSSKTWHHDLINSADVIVDTVDISSIKAMLDIHRLSKHYGKPIVFPLNMAYSGGVFVFDEQSSTFENMLKIDECIELEDAEEMYINKSIFMRWVDMCQPYMNDHNISIMNRFIGRVEEEGWCPLPQLGIASYTSAALSVTLLLKILLHENYNRAPIMDIIDPWEV